MILTPIDTQIQNLQAAAITIQAGIDTHKAQPDVENRQASIRKETQALNEVNAELKKLQEFKAKKEAEATAVPATTMAPVAIEGKSKGK